jgi:NAD(P)-dependent dehydrogenase (short-subunit alcohol dehydrogenase family)
MKLSGNVALVTGASSGIGQATAIELAKEGADVVANYFRHKENAEETAHQIQALGRRCITVQADVTKANQVENMVNNALKEYGKIDILVNNAGGIVKRYPIAETTEELWDQWLDFNLKSIFLCCRAVIPQMVHKKSGVIINISSVSARWGTGPGAVPYAAAKAGVEGFTRGLAKELADANIRVMCIAPGAIDTPFHTNRDFLESLKVHIPMKRIGRPEEVAKLIVFLASDDASYITGRVYDVNGGWMV